MLQMEFKQMNSSHKQNLELPLLCNFLQVIESGQIVAVLNTITNTVGPTLSIFIICHCGDELTQRFRHISNDFFQVSWYMLPLDMQKNWPFMIALGQKEIGLQGFGSFHYNYELYMKVGLETGDWRITPTDA